MDINKTSLDKHKEFGGKIAIQIKDTLDKPEKLSIYYSPGVGAVSSYVAEHPEETRDYTWLNNNVAVISDGSAVLGLGNIGPYGALPVMEGKAMLFKHFADIDSVPIVLDVHTADEIVAAVKAIAPSFGGINLEDIAAPICFEVEERLKAELPIPVFHDDQHGTAVVVLAGLINAAKVTDKNISDMKIVIVGAGAAGTAVTKLLHKYAPSAQLLMIDSKGIISADRTDLNDDKKTLLDFTNSANLSGSLEDALQNADVFIGLSKPGLLTNELIQVMAKDPIIFALANPNPEITPENAKAAGVRIIATGRSDYPNQVNNVLAFPGIFRGALDNRVHKITDEHKVAAAEIIASFVKNPSPNEFIPNPFSDGLVTAVSNVIR